MPSESLDYDSLLALSFKEPTHGFIAHSWISQFHPQSTGYQSIAMSNFTDGTYSSIEAIGNESSSYSAYYKLCMSQPDSMPSVQSKLSNVLHTGWNMIGISIMGVIDNLSGFVDNSGHPSTTSAIVSSQHRHSLEDLVCSL